MISCENGNQRNCTKDQQNTPEQDTNNFSDHGIRSRLAFISFWLCVIRATLKKVCGPNEKAEINMIQDVDFKEKGIKCIWIDFLQNSSKPLPELQVCPS